ncbi:tail protein X [Ectothiorhodospira mobilis]|uniref:tail protein X n=1 Tax=Ectothiorhodospira mobilis TaxID=195064 RepID=UPI001908846A|nr:phage tail protein [Ectothiorhodospira mobilis]
MNTYRTVDGEMLDDICWRVYGRESAVPDVLEANRHLADEGPRLPAGTLVQLPALPEPEAEDAVRLWD